MPISKKDKSIMLSDVAARWRGEDLQLFNNVERLRNEDLPLKLRTQHREGKDGRTVTLRVCDWK